MSLDNEVHIDLKQFVIIGTRRANRDSYDLPKSIKLTNQKMEV